MSVAAALVLGVVVVSRGCGGAGAGMPSAYRTQGAPFASGSVEGVLVFSTSAQARIAAVVRTEPDGCDDAVPSPASVVWIDGPTEGAAPKAAGSGLRLGPCGFEPPVAVAMKDTALSVRAASRDHRLQAWLDGVRMFDATQGGSAEIQLGTSGVWQIRCASGHPGEEAWVIVSANPYSVPTSPDGRFELRSVPEGSWTLLAWHPVLGTRKTSVEVAAKEATRLELEF